MATRTITPNQKLKKTGDNAFLRTFESLQLLGFTVLYYNFDFRSDQLKKFNQKMHELNATLLESANSFDEAGNKIENIWGAKLPHKVKEFPYRAKTYIIGGLPKGGMQQINMAIIQADNAIESYLVLAFSVLMEMDKKFGKVQYDCFYENLKDNAANYANGMKDEFIIQYIKDQLDLNVTK